MVAMRVSASTSVLVGIAVFTGCDRGCITDTPEGPCMTNISETRTGDSGVLTRVESCGELVLRVDWDLDSDGVFDCREEQFRSSGGALMRINDEWRPASLGSGCPPKR